MSTKITLNTQEGFDKITDTQKVTKGYFSGGSGKVLAADIYTMSLADTNEGYYFNISQTHPDSSSAETQFSVAFGHVGGSGSNTDGGDIEGATAAIYRQWATTLLAENEVSGGFRISGGETTKPTSAAASSAGERDSYIYVLVGKRARFKDRINKKNWTIFMSGSLSADGNLGSPTLALTDDSNTTQPTVTVAGPRYNIVSGSDGSVVQAASARTFGWFYPEAGVMVFSGQELSASIPGQNSGTSLVAQFYDLDANATASQGFGPNMTAAADAKNALRFINCVKGSGGYLKFRSEEDLTSVSYFCRARSGESNFSNNPTFVSGSANEIRHTTMKGNPTVYVTGVGLYNATNQLVAIAKLSTPVKKNFASEATIKVKLTY